MSVAMIHPHEHAVKHGRFVAPTADAQAAAEADLQRQIGRNLYRRGRALRECASDEMAGGWLAAEAAGEDAYWRAMMAQAAN